MTERQHELGQYFTTNDILKEKVCDFILNRPSIILEPSVGRGHLVSYIQSTFPSIVFDMFEIDKSLIALDEINRTNIVYADFLLEKVSRMYDTIIGNPPYVRTKSGNLYIDFIRKCVELLKPEGELIFIVPSDFLKLTSSSKLLNKMMEEGTFTHIFHPHDEKLFEGASIDVIVFRYCNSSSLEKIVLYNDEYKFISNSNGLITFSDIQSSNERLFSEYFDIYVGMVTGKEEIFKNDKLGNIKVLNSQDKIDNYIFIETFPSYSKEINDYLFNHKQSLITRKIRTFNEKNWFEWGAPRNISAIRKYKGQKCIYINTLTRKNTIAFCGNIDYFGGSLIMLRSKIQCDINKIVDYLNTETFRRNFTFSGRFKIGHRQISNSFIPSDCL